MFIISPLEGNNVPFSKMIYFKSKMMCLSLIISTHNTPAAMFVYYATTNTEVTNEQWHQWFERFFNPIQESQQVTEQPSWTNSKQLAVKTPRQQNAYSLFTIEKKEGNKMTERNVQVNVVHTTSHQKDIALSEYTGLSSWAQQRTIWNEAGNNRINTSFCCRVSSQGRRVWKIETFQGQTKLEIGY